MISTDIEMMYAGDVTLKYSARCFKVWSPLKAASVPGTMMSDWAKMIGITFAVLSRRGMNVFCPSRIRPRPITLRGIWIGMRRAATVTATVPATTSTITTSTASSVGTLHLINDGEHGGGELEDDARRDVRHDRQRKHRRPAEAATREQIVQREQGALRLVLQIIGEGLDVDAGRRDMGADAVHHQAQEREENLLLQLRHLEQVGQPGSGHVVSSRSCRPPARSSSGRRPTRSRPSR